MLRPKGMKKVFVIAPNSFQARLINKLYSLKVLHIIEHSKSEKLDIGNPLQNAEALSDAVVKTRSIRSQLNSREFMLAVPDEGKKKKNKGKSAHDRHPGIGDDSGPSMQFASLESVISQINEIYESATKTIVSYRDIDQEIKKLNSLLLKAHTLKRLGISISNISHYETIAHFIGHADKQPDLVSEVRKLTSKSYIKSATSGQKAITAIFIDASQRSEILSLLEKYRFQGIDFSDLIAFTGGKEFDEKRISAQLKALTERKSGFEKKMVLARQKYGDYLGSAEKYLAREIEKAEAPLKFGMTDETSIISGWVPNDKVDDVVAEIKKLTGDKVYIEMRDAGHHDDIPIELKNPKFAQPFEILMHLFSLPKFTEIDPTFFLFLTFPLFFGFMLGDFGYGLTTLVLFMILKKFMPKFSGFFNILIFSSLATIGFGLVFGEFFGAEEVMGFHIPHLLSRGHQIMDLLAWAIIIGVIHINIGLIIGFANEWMHHGFLKAVEEKFSWILLEIAIGAVSIVLLWLGEGVKGLIEIPSIFSNILSYARLMAIGLASVKLAEVVNEFATEFIHQGGIYIFYAVLLLVVGHVINIALGIIGPFLHSLRLHYVEFFTKFFKGGGKEYIPFGREID